MNEPRITYRLEGKAEGNNQWVVIQSNSSFERIKLEYNDFAACTLEETGWLCFRIIESKTVVTETILEHVDSRRP